MAQALIVENEKGLHLLYKHTLEKAGISCTFVRDAAEATTFLNTETPDIIFYDLSYRNQADAEVLQNLLVNPRFSQTKLIVTSTHPEHERDLNEYCDFHLKPIRPATLKQIAAKLQMKKAMQG